MLNRARNFEASLRHFTKKFPLQNILRCCKVLHSESCISDLFVRGIRILGNKLTAISEY